MVAAVFAVIKMLNTMRYWKISPSPVRFPIFKMGQKDSRRQPSAPKGTWCSLGFSEREIRWEWKAVPPDNTVLFTLYSGFLREIPPR